MLSHRAGQLAVPETILRLHSVTISGLSECVRICHIHNIYGACDAQEITTMISRVTHPSGHAVVVSRGEGLGALWPRSADVAEFRAALGDPALPPGIERGLSLPREDSSHLGPALEESR